MWKENVLARKVCIYLSEAKWHLNVLKPLIMTQALWHNRGEENEWKKTVLFSSCLCRILIPYECVQFQWIWDKTQHVCYLLLEIKSTWSLMESLAALCSAKSSFVKVSETFSSWSLISEVSPGVQSQVKYIPRCCSSKSGSFRAGFTS